MDLIYAQDLVSMPLIYVEQGHVMYLCTRMVLRGDGHVRWIGNEASTDWRGAYKGSLHIADGLLESVTSIGQDSGCTLVVDNHLQAKCQAEIANRMLFLPCQIHACLDSQKT